MELIVQVQSRETLDAALEARVAGVTLDLPREPDEAWWAEAAAWQAAARSQGSRFYLQWDRLVREAELPLAQETLAAVAALNPDALVLRDPGLCGEARRRHPGLVLHAAGACGFHNSPGLRLAEALGFSRVVLAGPLQFHDLAQVQRHTTMPLEVVLPQPCPGFGHLCLIDEYLGGGCPACCQPFQKYADFAASFLAALESLPGLVQMGVAAVRLGGAFSRGKALSRIIELCRLILETTPAGRPRVLAAAREVLAAFGEEFRLDFPLTEPTRGRPSEPAAAGRPQAPKERPATATGPSRVWLEARGYAEAEALSRDWREPLILALTHENYAAFLGEFRRWQPRQIIWRLPPVIRESALNFFQQAVATLKEGGFSRFVAGDWGALALAREAGGLVYGDQSLGIRNSLALTTARGLGLDRVCLPPGRGPQSWRDLVMAAPRGSFWGYLFHLPPLAICPGGEVQASREAGPAGEKLRWLSEDNLALLCPEAPEHLEQYRDWFEQYWVAPLVVSLSYSGLPWGQVPEAARPPRPAREARPVRPVRPGSESRGPRPEKKAPFKRKT